MRVLNILTINLPLKKIRPDVNQPRRDLGIDGEENRLMISMKKIGQRSPLAVTKFDKNTYKIIDGHRRYACAKTLGWKMIRCEVHPESNEGELKHVRFNLQNNRRPWKPLERSQEVKQIKKSMNLKTNKELAEYLHLSEDLVCQSLTLQKRREQYQKLMDEYELPETYQMEFVRLEPKIRSVKDFTREQIMRNLFDRVKHQVIRSAKDFRRLGSVFLRAHANEKELCRYLKDSDMKVDELAERTTRSGLVRDIESITQQISVKINNGTLPSELKPVIIQLRELLNKCVEK